MQACHSAKHPAVVGAKDETEQKSERAKPSTARGLDAFVGSVGNTRVPTSSARVPRVPLAQPQLAVLVSAITSLAVSVTAGRGCEAGDGRAERPHVMRSTVAIVRVTCSGFVLRAAAAAVPPAVVLVPAAAGAAIDGEALVGSTVGMPGGLCTQHRGATTRDPREQDDSRRTVGRDASTNE